MGRAKGVTLLLALACVAVFVLSPGGAEVGLCRCSQWWRRVVYVFFHGNVVHLGMNVYALLYVVFLFPVGMRLLCCALLAAVSVPGVLLGDVPAVGLSGVVFFLLGGILYMVEDRRRYVLTNVGVIALGVLLPNIAWGVHVWCFVWGLVYSFVYGRC
jgi:membrane associated rhomboid family serine protease